MAQRHKLADQISEHLRTLEDLLYVDTSVFEDTRETARDRIAEAAREMAALERELDNGAVWQRTAEGDLYLETADGQFLREDVHTAALLLEDVDLDSLKSERKKLTALPKSIKKSATRFSRVLKDLMALLQEEAEQAGAEVSELLKAYRAAVRREERLFRDAPSW